MTPTARLLLVSRGLRAFADGFVSLLLPAYLSRLGFSLIQIGSIATGTLLGSAGMTLAIGFAAHRFATRRLLMAASLAMFLTGVSFAGLRQFWPLVLVAVFGTLNPSSGDVSVFLPLEQSLLTSAGSEGTRTSRFACYSLVGSLIAAVGALAAGLPDLTHRHLGIDEFATMRMMFVAYALIGLSTALLYRRLPEQKIEADAPRSLGKSRGIVLRLAALFSLDSFGGGFIVQSLLALWLFHRFQLSLATAAAFFFWAGLLSAFSYLVAIRISRRIGLVNTMVFTHLPANLCLIAAAFVPNLTIVLGLLLVRAALSQMDVPTRTSYVMSVVTPPERAAAASITAVPRSLASAISPMLSAGLMAAGSFAAPLVLAGSLKSAYDLLLLGMFGKIKPPEESFPQMPRAVSRNV